MTIFTFTTRETYLTYRAEWKVKYATASDEIRAAKNAIRAAHREQGYASYLLWSKLFTNQKLARELLLELKDAKVEAHRQWTESHMAMH